MDLKPTITHEFKFDEIQQTFDQLVQHGNGNIIAAVIIGA